MGGDGGGRAVVSTRNTVSAIAGTGSPLVVSRFAARWSTRLRGLPPSATDKLLSTLAPRSGCGLRDDSLRGGELGSMAVDADTAGFRLRRTGNKNETGRQEWRKHKSGRGVYQL